MTKLDISAYGVQELNHQEMVETEGGGIVTGLVIAAVAALCTGCIYVDNHTEYNSNFGNGNTSNDGIGNGNHVDGNGNNNGKGKK